MSFKSSSAENMEASMPLFNSGIHLKVVQSDQFIALPLHFFIPLSPDREDKNASVPSAIALYSHYEIHDRNVEVDELALLP